MSDKNENNTEFTIPKNIKLDNYIYSFKDILANNFYSFRCKHRKNYNLTIKVSKNELEKLTKNKDTTISFIYNPKISFMISKYKDYLIKVYEKIKSSLVNKENKKIEKFSIVNDILNFISNYNIKYKKIRF